MSKLNLLRASAISAGLCWALAARLALPAETVQPPLNANEAKIVAALDDKTELEFVDQPLSDVIDYLKERHGIEIQLDNKALTDAGLGTDAPITKNIKGIRLESALDLMLNELDMTYLVCHEVLFLTSKKQAQNMLSTKTYPVGDLVVREDGAGAGDDYQSLIELITSAAPTTWNEVGGPGSIQEFRNARAVVISQTFAVHRQIERLLADVRAARREQAAAAPKQAEDEVQDDATLYVKVYRLPAAWAGPVATHFGGGVGGGAAPIGQPAVIHGKAEEPKGKPQHVQPQMAGGLAMAAGMAAMGGGTGRSRSAAAPRLPSAEELAKAIPAVILPESWDISGGLGAIRAAGNSLIVRQSRPVHREIARLLEQLK